MPSRPRRSTPRRSRGLRVLRVLVLLLLVAIIAALSLAGGLYVALARNLPHLDTSSVATAAQTSKIFDNAATPTLLAELHGTENREIVSGDQIPQVMRDAVVAVEDRRFYVHQGVDFIGILRALYTDVRHRSVVQGGSTITQQYIKNAYITDERTLDRKIKEATLAYQLEKQWSKQKILDEYLNTIYFGEGAYGVEAAAQTYFGIPAKQLTAPQAALLAAIPKSPTAYSPRQDKTAALERRDMILNEMFAQRYLTGDQLQSALAAPITLAKPAAPDQGPVPYWVEMVREQLVAKYGSNTVLKGGLRVYTSIDLAKQKLAEKAVASILDAKGDPTAALVSIDLHTGRIVAMVGGTDFKTQQFNLATQGHRQPGSAFKAFVLATALEQGMAPTNEIESGPFTADLPSGPWKVKSTDLGPISLNEATAQSSNGAYARLIMDPAVGAQRVVDMAHRLGVSTAVNADPAIALGGLETGVTPLEMAEAYASLGTGGNRLSGSVAFDKGSATSPISIVRVENAKGEVLDENTLVTTPVLDPPLAAMVTNALQGVIDHGTGTAAAIGRPAAGKTGTTENYRDAWFVGYTPDMVTAVWVGYSEEAKAMTDVHGIKVTGGSLPAQIWAAYMRPALKDVPASDFAQPDGSAFVTVNIDPTTGMVATQWCPTSEAKLYAKGKEPTDPCTKHGPQQLTLPDLVGMTLAEATAALEKDRFVVATVERVDPTAPAGSVVAQDPPAGTKLLQGKTVTLTVAAGSATPGKVPDVSGLDVAAARVQLEAAGYTVTVKETGGGRGAPGTVVAQSPRPGAALAAGGAVTLTVVRSSVAPTTTTTTPVPPPPPTTTTTPAPPTSTAPAPGTG